jgi:hypothetical protein
MFNALKDRVSKGSQALLEQELQQRLKEKLDVFRSLKPGDIQNDEMYSTIVVRPLWLYIKLQSGGALMAAQKVVEVNIEERFSRGLFRVRNDLIRVENGTVSLVPDFNDRLVPTLMQAFRDPK